MRDERVELTSKDGTALCGVLVRPEKSRKGTVVLVHGITVEKDEDGFYTELAGVLVQSGFESLRFDFRGHGESGGSPTGMTIQGEVEDLTAAVEYLRKSGPDRVAIVGTSFGAGIAILYSQIRPETVSSLSLLSPVLDYKRTFLMPETEWTKEWFTEEAFKQAERTGTLDLEGFLLGRDLLDEFKILNPRDELLTLTVPTLIIHGTDDTMVPYDVAREVGSEHSHCRFLSVEGADHGFEGFEEMVFSEVRQWIQKHLAD